ncbi:hypothetical protein ACIBG6_36770 [Streptomyces sp. NPDC050842]|uniref:hypothetical protein n=1 Tax=Streptomyces sp. NPDC050842 TaxID=3365636 RepID=UPI0037AF5CE7
MARFLRRRVTLCPPCAGAAFQRYTGHLCDVLYSCNTYEGKSTAPSFLQNKEGTALHLLECRVCLKRRTLPARYHAALARMHVPATDRHIIRSRR